MNDQEIIKNFLDMGIQLTNDALAIIRKDPEFFILEVKKLKIRPFFLTKDIVNDIIVRNQKKESNFQIMKELFLERKPLKIDDYVNFYLKKYEKIKDIFTSVGFSAISINKITENTREFSTIGLIRQKNSSSLVLEDPTGNIEIFFEGVMKQKLEDFDRDDVVGVYCEKQKEKFITKKILHPDIPLNREIKKTNEEIILKINSNEGNPLSPRRANPVYISYGNIIFLILPKKFFDFKIKIDSEFLLKLLKRRFLLPSTNDYAISNPDDFILVNLPDFIITDIEPSIAKNYKGTTIISVFDKEYEVNLHTREVKEL
ncbi:MAG: hypothetical protein QXJ06_02445 [Candidatus Aenigmatarchaeota archaeon]